MLGSDANEITAYTYLHFTTVCVLIDRHSTERAYQTSANDGFFFPYVALVSDRDEIFDNADFITLHMAATAENKHGIGAREFARMKKTACLINTARGSLVDEAALIEALRAGEIAGAGLDATEPEPADAASPLFRMENVIMTPHCGGSTKESKSRSSLGAAKGCDEVLTGKPITSPVL